MRILLAILPLARCGQDFAPAALNFLTAFWGGSVRQYRPEARYMRWSGVEMARKAWTEYGRNREAAGFVRRPAILNGHTGDR
jgi:hypothetical protein